jgi:hypothetical protein
MVGKLARTAVCCFGAVLCQSWCFADGGMHALVTA